MPFKSESAKKRAIRAVERGVAYGRWHQGSLVSTGGERACALGLMLESAGVDPRRIRNGLGYWMDAEYGLSGTETCSIARANDTGGSSAAIDRLYEIPFDLEPAAEPAEETE